MPRLTPAAEQERRDRIINAALDCFAERGVHATTMQDICRRSGLSPGAVYCWFPGKETIIEAVARQRHQHERELLDTALHAADSRTALHAFFDAYFDWLADPAEQHRRRVSVLVWAESLVDDRLRSIVGDGIAQRTLALDAIRSGQAAGTVTRHADADAITRLALALIQGFILQQAWEPEVDIEGYRRALDLVIDALTPRQAD
ncbi:TetR/AcrR family transcriptional regulator [Nocardia sp. NPDC050175]|uniref:TetR/AcrR family transcriptional regulator n=1 Tax=Nocardia sp. NPDC050175 TaxID=3364317 RepID=UPI00379F317E